MNEGEGLEIVESPAFTDLARPAGHGINHIAELAIMSGVGHMPHIEDVDQFNRLLLAFLQSERVAPCASLKPQKARKPRSSWRLACAREARSRKEVITRDCEP